ncbi:hypothetical protein ACHHYP_04061 [Achlya hypogyna]|uniref:PX domain-containing protein n=1 Tax=Achlya hypogyna TaxID=1202772 RepID=A0A1V9Z280_ACHHY|nr:hypothetical protein ACHHYP_04061 [Achlya hypogyna]
MNRRSIPSSKRARGASKKSKKLLLLEQAQAQGDAAPEPRKETPVELQEDSTTDVDEEEDVVVVASPTAASICTRFLDKPSWSPKDIKAHAATPDATFCVSIPSFRDVDEGYVVYRVVVETPYHSWSVEKRYSEFVHLAQTLELKNIAMDLPPKTWFKVTQDTVLADRRERLEAGIIDLLSRDNSPAVPVVREFFQLDVFAMSLADGQ